MSDAPPATGTPDAPADTTDVTETDTKDWKAEAEKWQTLARKNEERAKANSTAAKELEQLRQQTMSDTEKAIAQARSEGRAEALSTMTSKLVTAEVRAAAAGRMSEDQLATLIEGLNTSAFVNDDGEVDQARVSRFVDGLAPQPDETATNTFPDLGQGARGQSLPLNGDPLLRDLKSKLGIR